jgi:penicillin amidase
VLLGTLVLGAGAFHLHRRALPAASGRRTTPGLDGRVEIVRDRWGVPHVFAASPRDAYFGLGYATGQDRLFQLEVHRRIASGRLAELFGLAALEVDRLFRTMDLQGIARRRLAASSPEVREALARYADGVNAAAADSAGRLPVEFTLLRASFAPVSADEYAGLLGYMTWILNASWDMDPLYERLAARVGEEKARLLFPYDHGGEPAVFGPDAANGLRAAFDAVGLAWGPAGSNTWVVAPGRSATGHALLANDPHLTHGVPSLWYEAHLHAPGLDVAGVTLPGLPVVIIGHNRRIAWGTTNLMLDGADFFVEHLDGPPVQNVMYRGQWTPVVHRREHIVVKGQAPVDLDVVETPHGPLVNHLLPKLAAPTSYQWVFRAAEDASEFDGFFRLNAAGNWAEFQDAVSRFGATAQNMSYADVDGHIGLQATGRLPRRLGRWDGNGFRKGWDGSDEWDGFLPFAENPSAFDPPSGLLAAANNVAVPAPARHFLSSHWEPPDRILRIREVLGGRDKVSIDDMRALHADVTLAAWPELRDALRAAFADRAAPAPIDLERLWRWDGAMRADSAEAAVFAAFYKNLYHAIVDDEMGDLAAGYRAKTNMSAIMVRAALFGSAGAWLDDVRTADVEGRDEILRRALTSAAAELRACCGDDPARWAWGRRHTMELRHPIGRAGGILAAYFNLGPFPAGGHALTVNKGEFTDEDYRVTASPSMRHIIDMGHVESALSVIPAGQSGIPASPHYADQLDLWRKVDYHPLLMNRAAIDAVAEGTWVLEP